MPGLIWSVSFLTLGWLSLGFSFSEDSGFMKLPLHRALSQSRSLESRSNKNQLFVLCVGVAFLKVLSVASICRFAAILEVTLQLMWNIINRFAHTAGPGKRNRCNHELTIDGWRAGRYFTCTALCGASRCDPPLHRLV